MNYDDQLDLEDEAILMRARYKMQNWRKARFYSQLAISMIVVIFCMCMVATEDIGCERTVFMSVITAIVGFWLPQPTAQ